MFQMYLKVGSMASFYPMKKHASWIPALARVEEVRAYGDWDEAKLHCGQAEEFLGLNKKTDS